MFDLIVDPGYAYIILTPLKPHYYIVKRVYRGINYFSYFTKNIDCWYSLEPPRRGGSNNGYPQSMFWASVLSRNMKNINNRIFFSVRRNIIFRCHRLVDHTWIWWRNRIFFFLHGVVFKDNFCCSESEKSKVKQWFYNHYIYEYWKT